MKNESQGRVIGMDIHPTVFSACALMHRAGKEQEAFLHDRVDMDDLERWFRKHHQVGDHFVMESGCNSFETAERLQALGAEVTILESYRIGQIQKAYLKTDKVDARKIAKVYLSGLGTHVWQPDEKTRTRREVFAVYERATRECTRQRNHIWAWLTQHGIKRPKGVKLTQQSGLFWLLHCREWNEEQQEIIVEMHDDLVHAEQKRKTFRRRMAIDIAQDRELLKLQQLCGLRLVAIYALAAIIGDIRRFKSTKQLVAYIGLQPRVNQSGISRRGGGLCHSGRKDLRAVLVQAAHAILRKGGAANPLAVWGWKLTFRTCRNVAAIAVARKLVTYVWYLLQGHFTPLNALSTSQKSKLQKLAIEIGTAKRRAMGYPTIQAFIQEKEAWLLAET